MRKLVGVALLFLALAAAFLLLFQPQGAAQKQGAQAAAQAQIASGAQEENKASAQPLGVAGASGAQVGAPLQQALGAGANQETRIPRAVSFGIKSAEIANSDGAQGKVAVLWLRLFPQALGAGDEVLVFCGSAPLQKSILVLDHASAPGIDSSLSDKVESELSKCGLSSRPALLTDALSSQNAVIISPTGAVPAGLLQSGEKLNGSNSRAIVISSIPGRAIDENSRLEEYNATRWFEEIPLLPGRGQQAAKQAARQALIPPSAQPLVLHPAPGNFTAAVPVDGSEIWCRAVFFGSEGECRHSDSMKLEAPKGSLSGPASVLAQTSAVFLFTLPPGSEEGRSLRFFAVADCQGSREFRQEIAGGEIRGSWASSFSLSLPEGGDCIVRVLDQFGRVHAAAFVAVKSLVAVPVSHEANRYEFLLTFGGRGVDGAVDVWLDNGEKKQYRAYNGTLVVFAAPAIGNRTMRFSYGGAQAQYAFFASGSSLLWEYARLGVPALAFLAAVFFLLRAKRGARYAISFPELSQVPRQEMAVGARELQGAWEAADRKNGGHCLPCSAEQIAGELLRHRGQENCFASPQSVLLALRRLASCGIFIETGCLFLPRAKSGGFSPWQLAALCLIHDIFIERGILFSRRAIQKARGRGLEVALFSSKEKILSGIGGKRRIVVFESRQQIEQVSSILRIPSKGNVQIKLALSNGKLIFAASTRTELERVIP